VHESPSDFFAACAARTPVVMLYSKGIAVWTDELIALLASKNRVQIMDFQQKDLQSFLLLKKNEYISYGLDLSVYKIL